MCCIQSLGGSDDSNPDRRSSCRANGPTELLQSMFTTKFPPATRSDTDMTVLTQNHQEATSCDNVQDQQAILVSHQASQNHNLLITSSFSRCRFSMNSLWNFLRGTGGILKRLANIYQIRLSQ
eukprot:m.265766 g.265766  ORF g.265766 m.265766 type:complete len:123 (-) comp63087_c0_seq1:364-732(-)